MKEVAVKYKDINGNKIINFKSELSDIAGLITVVKESNTISINDTEYFFKDMCFSYPDLNGQRYQLLEITLQKNIRIL